MRTHLPLTLLCSAFTSCSFHETGVDRSHFTGSVVIPPASFEEGETAQGADDTIDTPVELGTVGYRYTLAHGTCLLFKAQPNGGPVEGDMDFYTFTPQQDGTMTLGLDFAGPEAPTDTGSTDEVAVYQFTVYSVDAQGNLSDPILDEATKGSYGTYRTHVELSGGTTYAVRVAGRKNTGDDDNYTLSISGLDPNDTRFLVGAYASSDINDRGNPLGGAEVTDFTLDEGTFTWSGNYEILYVRKVVTCPASNPTCGEAASSSSARRIGDTGTGDTGTGDTGTGDTGTGDTGTGDTGTGDTGAGDTGTGDTGSSAGEGDSGGDTATVPDVVRVSRAYLFAGNFASLNTGLSAGVHYSSEPVEIQIASDRPADADPTEVSRPLVIDTIQPKIYGWTVAEVEPNDDIDHATDAGMASGAGIVDVFTGSIVFESDNPGGGGGDYDYFKFQVPTELNALITATWNDGNTYNLDWYVLDSEGNIIADGYEQGDSNPESADLERAYGVVLQPNTTYYLVEVPWSGPVGEANYTIEAEWQAP